MEEVHPIACKVRAGKSLFIPVSRVEVSDKESPNSSIDQLTQIAKQDQDRFMKQYGII